MATIREALEGTRVHHARIAKAEALEAQLSAEYRGIEMDVEAEEGEKECTWLFICGDYEARFENTVPELADVLEQLQEQGASEEDLAGEPEEDEEPEGGRSVVREEYRQQYRAISTNKQTNGDWLAETLTGLFWDPKQGFNIAGFEALLDQNGVDMTAPWARVADSGRNGWQGRFRMNGRQALEKRLAVSGVFRDGETELTAESDPDFGAWLIEARDRHAGYLAKLAKAEAKKAAATVEASEPEDETETEQA
jgi:hypothetical protein